MSKLCPECKDDFITFNRRCGADVCEGCNHHPGFARCYCGWSLSGRDGRTELEELGENLGEDYDLDELGY